MIYNVSDFIDAPKRLQSIAKSEYMSLLESSIEEEDKFISLLKVFYATNPWFIQAMAMGSKHSFYSHAQYFTEEEFNKFVTPKYKHGSLTINQGINLLIKLYEQNKLTESSYRMKMLSSAEMGMVGDEYALLMSVLKQEFLPETVYNLIKKLWKEKKLTFVELYEFDFTIDYEALKEHPSRRIFGKGNMENLAFINEELETYILFKNTIMNTNKKILTGVSLSNVLSAINEKRLSIQYALPVIVYIGKKSNMLYMICSLNSNYEYKKLSFAPNTDNKYCKRAMVDTDAFRKALVDDSIQYIILFDASNNIEGILSKQNKGIKVSNYTLKDFRTLKLPNYTSESGYMYYIEGVAENAGNERITIICDSYVSYLGDDIILNDVILCQGYYYHK